MSILWDFFTVLPARAGVILAFIKINSSYWRTTRTSGGDPLIWKNEEPFDRYYPHERG